MWDLSLPIILMMHTVAAGLVWQRNASRGQLDGHVTVSAAHLARFSVISAYDQDMVLRPLHVCIHVRACVRRANVSK